MDDTIHLGRILGIRVGVNWTLALAFGLIAFTLATDILPGQVPGDVELAYLAAAVACAGLFFASLLAHELAHAVVARRLGVQVQGITLWLFGGVARLRGESPSPGIEARIAVVGPLASVGLAALFFGIDSALQLSGGWDRWPLLGVSAQWLWLANLTIALFNLVPAYPLDGGRLLRALLWKRFDSRLRATTVAARGGRVFGYLMIAAGVVTFFLSQSIGSLWTLLLGWFLYTASRTEERQVALQGALGSVRVGDLMTPEPVTAPDWVTVDEFLRSYAFTHRFNAYPLRHFEGGLAGMVTLSRLGSVPVAVRRSTRVMDIACPMREVPTAQPEERVLDVLDRMSGCTEGRLLVVRDGQLLGLLAPADISRALRLGVAPGSS
jgi:Zn-dependent protease/CBS domain-containing protein